MTETTSSNNTHTALVLGEIGLVHNLGQADIPITVGSEIKDNLSLYSKYTKGRIYFSDYKSEQFIEELIDYGKKQETKPVLFSDDDHAILNIAQHQKELEPYFLFSFPDADMVTKLLDKQLFCDLIEQYDLPAPRSVTLSGVEELSKVTEANLRFPCIIKPSFKQAWWGTEFGDKVGAYQKAYKVESLDDLNAKYRQIAQVNPYVVVQEFIEGDENQIYSVNMFVNNDGLLRGYFIAQKLRTYPIKAGEGCYIVTVKDVEMTEMAYQIAKKMKLRGLLNIQFKRDKRTGRPVLLEIHTRNSVWSYLGTAAGVNVAALYYRELTGQLHHRYYQYQPGVIFVFLEKDIKAFLQNLKVHQIGVGKWLKSYFRKLVIGGVIWSDPKPALMNLWFAFNRKVLGRKHFRIT
jgi:D-aspartate ligase